MQTITITIEYDDDLIGSMRLTDSLFDIEGVESVTVL